MIWWVPGCCSTRILCSFCWSQLHHARWLEVNVYDVRAYAEEGNPGRFEFVTEPDVHSAMDTRQLLWMRTSYRPKKTITDAAISRIFDPSTVPAAIYKAPSSDWKTLKTDGIRAQPNCLIHLSPRDFIEENTGSIGTFFKDMLKLTKPGESGRKATSFIYIHLDVEKALMSGVDFYRTRLANIVTTGDRTGVIRPSLFKDITQVNIEKDSLK
ncbi:hypothetical protein FA15DRAFT_604842 [Coprinopsis marcescibilis]|uniref:Uncharacterized protein n=1 Tax=Coprinopsis marcescibilis TaxID=230819 RepID=A0A5C3KCA5_COPMA|nr:hypothetical protein FA15DRAFT_604842 [Coprinopsis marcescibilis]